MKKIISILIGIFLPVTAFAAPTSWDFTSGILQPLQSQWSAQVKVPYLTATSTTQNNTLPKLLFTTATGTSATTTNFFSTTASTTNLFGTLINGFGLATCNDTNEALTWASGVFGCTTISASGGSGNVATSSSETSGRIPFWTSTGATPATLSGGDSEFTWSDSLKRLTITNLLSTNSTSTNATTTNLNVSGNLFAPNLTSALILTGSDGLFAEYTGTSCTNQFVRSLSALGAATCATVENTDLANSTISGVSLGGTLNALTAGDGLTSAGTYTGATARTFAIDFTRANTWSGTQTFGDFLATNGTTTNATSTNLSVSGAINLMGETITNFTNYVRGLFSAGTGLSYSSGEFSINQNANLTWTGQHIFSNILNSTTTSATTTNMAIIGQVSCNGSSALQTNSDGSVTCGAVSASASINPIASDGSDGDVTVSTEITLTRDMYYEDLVVANGGTINTGGYRIYASKTVTVQNGGIVQNNGGHGGNGTNSSGCGTLGAGGSAGTAAPGITVPAGRAGQTGAGTNCSGTINGNAGTASTFSLSDWSGATGGNGGSATVGGGSGGAGGATSSSPVIGLNNIKIAHDLYYATSTYPVATYSTTIPRQTYAVTAGAGSGGAGGYTSSCASAGGPGGGSGGSGGVVWIAAKTITIDSGGIVRALGGNGGNAGNHGGGCSPIAGAGGGGAGGNGGVLVFVASSITNNGTLSTAGGTGGSPGTGGGSPTSGGTGRAGRTIMITNQ